jgi:hypothetical protein
MDNKVVKGTPTPMFLSAERRGWKHVKGPVAIDLNMQVDLPTEGKLKTKFSIVEFDIAKDLHVRFDFGTLVKALFSGSLYPKLNQNEVFAISDLLVDKENGIVTIVGNVLERLDE